MRPGISWTHEAMQAGVVVTTRGCSHHKPAENLPQNILMWVVMHWYSKNKVKRSSTIRIRQLGALNANHWLYSLYFSFIATCTAGIKAASKQNYVNENLNEWIAFD